MIQESKLTLNSRTPNIQNFNTVRKYRYQGLWFTQMDSQINEFLSESRITRYCGRSSFGRVDYYSQAEKHVDHCQHLHTQAIFCTGGYNPSVMTTSDTLILGDVNAHHSQGSHSHGKSWKVMEKKLSWKSHGN